MNKTYFPTIAVTPGEPAGIGPDLLLKLAEATTLPCKLVAVADPDLLRERAAILKLDITIEDWEQQKHQQGALAVAPVSLRATCRCGQLNANNAIYVLETLDLAVQSCLDGTYDALVTGPVHKGIINDAGIPFTGHTEYLAEKTGSELPVMLLVAPELRVALATTHLPLADVSARITRSLLTAVLNVLHSDLSNLIGIASPRIAVLGLNPHAGEGGHLGTEEIEVIGPVISELQTQGWQISGPYPADTIFAPALRKQFDVIVAMYHDQGLPALKALGFGNAVNVTLGLPILRTSVDHGTALERAGTGEIDTGSLLNAINLAATVAQTRRRHDH